MILLRKGETNTITVTLTEKQVTESPDYHFVFKAMGGEVITVDFVNGDDNSTDKTRYNSFEIDTDASFLNAKTGIYSYRVYENNAEGELLETGIMKLLPQSEFSVTEYQGEATTYKSYNAS